MTIYRARVNSTEFWNTNIKCFSKNSNIEFWCKAYLVSEVSQIILSLLLVSLVTVDVVTVVSVNPLTLSVWTRGGESSSSLFDRSPESLEKKTQYRMSCHVYVDIFLPSNKAFLTPTTVIWLLTLFFFLSFPKRHKFEKTSDILEVWIRTTELHCQYCAILTFMELWFSNNSIMLLNTVRELHYRTSWPESPALCHQLWAQVRSVKDEQTVNCSLCVSWRRVWIIYLSLPFTDFFCSRGRNMDEVCLWRLVTAWLETRGQRETERPPGATCPENISTVHRSLNHS